MQIEVRALELLASKLCHDLISPVSAINNGVELIEDIGESVVDEAMKLIGDSAAMATKRLRLFRLAYGRAGSEEGLAVKDVLPVLEAYFGGGKITLKWDNPDSCHDVMTYRGSLKVLINLLILGEELLAYGGVLTVSCIDGEESKGLKIQVSGRAAQLTDVFRLAFEGTTPVDELTPRTIQAYVTGKLAAFFGITLAHLQPIPDQLDFTLLIPRRSDVESSPI